MSEEPLQLLNQAKERAERLVGELQSQCAEVEAHPPVMSPTQLQQGRAAMQNAIAAAQRTLASLEAAIANSSEQSN